MSKILRDEFSSIFETVFREYEKYLYVSDIMSTPVLTIDLEAPLEDAVRILGERHIGSLVVTEKDNPAGIVTERDLLSKVIAQDRDPAKIKVREVMSAQLITVKPTNTIKEAAQRMIKEKGRLVVLKEGKVCGIITASDLILSIPKIPQTMDMVDDAMTKKIVAVEGETSVREAAKLMGRLRIGSVLIRDGGGPNGIFTERDLMTKILSRKLPLEVRVGELASRPLITIPLGSSIHRTAVTMAARHVRRLPVATNNEIVGIITARDLVEAYSK